MGVAQQQQQDEVMEGSAAPEVNSEPGHNATKSADVKMVEE